MAKKKETKVEMEKSMGSVEHHGHRFDLHDKGEVAEVLERGMQRLSEDADSGRLQELLHHGVEVHNLQGASHDLVVDWLVDAYHSSLGLDSDPLKYNKYHIEHSINHRHIIPLPPIDNRASKPRPRFELLWGDGPRDQIETDDEEVLRLVARNPYHDIVLKDVVITQIEVVLVNETREEPVPLLPNKTPSVDIRPAGDIWFGDLRPEDEPKMRETTLISKGAIRGPYRLKLHFNCWIEDSLRDEDAFNIELVAS